MLIDSALGNSVGFNYIYIASGEMIERRRSVVGPRETAI